MKKFLLLFYSLVLSVNVFGQNLVPNPSFEVHDTCPYLIEGQIYLAIPWFQPATYAGNIINSSSSDYFNVCSTNAYMGVPSNGAGYQYPRTGNAYAGIFFYAYNETREYLEVKLTDSMIAGGKYNVEYFVSMGFPFTTATDNFHFYFSNDSLLSDTTSLHAIRVTPSVVNALGNYITDTLNWTRISGVYIAAGGERFLTIGNFYDNAHTDTINPGTSAYYLVDDVSVSLDSIEGQSEIINQNSTIHLFPNPTHSSFTLQCPLSLVGSESRVLGIYNSLGEIVRREIIHSVKEEIDLGLAAGVYYIRVGTAVQKLIVY